MLLVQKKVFWWRSKSNTQHIKNMRWIISGWSVKSKVWILVMQTIFFFLPLLTPAHQCAVSAPCVRSTMQCVCENMFLGVPLNTKAFWSLVRPWVPQYSCCYGDAHNLTLFFFSFFSAQTSHRSTQEIICHLTPNTNTSPTHSSHQFP